MQIKFFKNTSKTRFFQLPEVTNNFLVVQSSPKLAKNCILMFITKSSIILSQKNIEKIVTENLRQGGGGVILTPLRSNRVKVELAGFTFLAFRRFFNKLLEWDGSVKSFFNFG